MSERTVIGGVSYETVGSNTSNLLLRCNGTARIQWGNKLIDLIKNGKIAGDNSMPISIVSDESDIKYDGIYIVNKDKSQLFFVCKNGERYNLSGADLYISASTKQDFTNTQKQQIQENIGLCYQTLEDVHKANLKNGIVYVLEDKQLYTINEGNIEQFEAILKTVEVEKENDNGEVIQSSYKIVLQVLNQDYIVLESDHIICNKDLVLDNAQIYSKDASSDYGFRLYMDNNKSTLEVDNLKVRNKQENKQYTEITYSELKKTIYNGKLNPHEWYLISDFQNHWNMHTQIFRPILVQAKDSKSLCRQGYLYNCKDVVIHYEYDYNVAIEVVDNIFTNSKGLITWMRDPNGNEANFDFLNYDVQDSEQNSIITLHSTEFSDDLSVFPTGSFNNKITVNNLYGTVINNGVVDNTNTCIVNFKYDDSGNNRMEMHDNIFQCSGSGLVLSESCSKFFNNKFGVINNTSPIDANIYNCNFRNITNCTFGSGDLTNIECKSDLSDQNFSQETHSLLYDISKDKNIYVNNASLNITSLGEQVFHRGMILMHSGFDVVPYGWAVCDGGTYTFNGVESTTPDLRGRFIKAVVNSDEVAETDVHADNKVTLTKQNLPAHSHPHKSHTHSFAGSDSYTLSTSTNATSKNAITSIEGGTSGFSGDDVTIEDVSIDISISGNTAAATSQEDTQTWENTPFSIEPNYYSLIFIMKL